MGAQLNSERPESASPAQAPLRRPLQRPAQRMYALCAAVLINAGLGVWLALEPLWLGIRFGVSPSGADVVIARVADQRVAIPQGAVVSGLQGRDGAQLALLPMDLIEEPDLYDSYAEMDRFFERQAQLDRILRSGEVRLQWRSRDGMAGDSLLTPGTRPIDDLPFAFWLQLFTGSAGLLIAGWVYLLRPNDWGARMFALTGLALPISATSAAIYSTRELALPEALFRQLSMLNHFGATAFGMALVALFLCYPRQLVRPSTLLIIPAVFGTWFLADVFRWAPDSDWGFRIPLILELLLVVAGAVIQWRKTARLPLERASLLWLVLSTLLSCSLFIVLIVAHSVLGMPAPISQGHAFGFFLVMYIGIALGLGRYRLFDLGVWAYRVLLWVGGALLVVALDVALIAVGISEVASLGTALLVAGWLYFPLRQWLWQRLVTGNEVRPETLLPQISDLAFLPPGEAREAQWDAVLRRLFDPIEVQRGETRCSRPTVLDDGLTLCVPGLVSIEGRTLRYAGSGRRLFSSRDAAFAATLSRLAEQLLVGRDGFDRGVQQERQRIARDLHDNIGARLLRLIHHLRGTADAEIARDALKELRAAVSAIDGRPAPLPDALADWHVEADARCAAANVQLRWIQDRLPPVNLPPRTKVALGSILREAVTNALKHADPRQIEIRISPAPGSLRLSVVNDGVSSDPACWQEGFGLRSIRGRLHDLGGSLDIAAQAETVRLSMSVPVEGLF